MLQAYSALPFNITSGVTTIQGTPGRPIVNGEFIERNAGDRQRLLQPEPPGQPYVPARTAGCSSKRWPKGSTSRIDQNVLTRNTNFGTGAYPTNPSPTFGQVTAVGEPRTFQLGVRARF